MAQYVDHGTPLAVETCRKAIENADATPDEIEKVVFVSSSGFTAPGIDNYVVEQLGLPRTVSRSNIGFMGCGGAINGLHAASNFCMAEPGKKALLVCLEIHSIHVQPDAKTASELVGNAIFGDGCAAVVMRGEDPAAAPGKWGISGRYSHLLEDSQNAVQINLTHQGLVAELTTDLAKLVRGGLGGFVDGFLEKTGLQEGGKSNIDLWGVHPGGAAILKAASAALDLDNQKHLGDSWGVLRDHGNMSSSTVLFVLDRLLSSEKAAALMPSSRLMAMAFSPGVSVEGAMFEKC